MYSQFIEKYGDIMLLSRKEITTHDRRLLEFVLEQLPEKDTLVCDGSLCDDMGCFYGKGKNKTLEIVRTLITSLINETK